MSVPDQLLKLSNRKGKSKNAEKYNLQASNHKRKTYFPLERIGPMPKKTVIKTVPKIRMETPRKTPKMEKFIRSRSTNSQKFGNKNDTFQEEILTSRSDVKSDGGKI